MQTEAVGVIDSILFSSFTTSIHAFLIRDPTFSLEVRRSRDDKVMCNTDRPFDFRQGLTIFRSCFHRTASTGITSLESTAPQVERRDADRQIWHPSRRVDWESPQKRLSPAGHVLHNNFSGIAVTTLRSGF